jgi:hypothetical protein
MFFHEIAYGIDDDWKQTWTTRPINGKKKMHMLATSVDPKGVE